MSDTARKLNAEIKFAAIEAMTKDVFGKREKVLAAQEIQLAKDVIKQTLGAEYLRFTRCPREWFDTQSYVQLNTAGRTSQLAAQPVMSTHSMWGREKAMSEARWSYKSDQKGLSFTLPHKFNSVGFKPLLADDLLCIRILAHIDATVQLIKDANTLRAQVKAITDSCSTVKKLLEVWPEGKKYLPESAFEAITVTGLPAVIIVNVNAAIAAYKVA